MQKISISIVCILLGAAACSKDTLGRVEDKCQAGGCDDGNPCTDDRCEPTVGCINDWVADATPCEDGNACTLQDQCSAGSCVPGTGASDGTACGSAGTRQVCIAQSCEVSFCGDGFTDEMLGEECDDGNNASNDGCEPDCTILMPEVTITSPERGATLIGQPEIVVSGVVEDFGAGVASVIINGVSATLSGTSFTATLPAAHGLNAITAVATNSVGTSGEATVGVYHSSAYQPFAANEVDSELLPAGMVARFGQRALDDGDHPCSYEPDGTYVCTTVDDLATVGELLLNNLDVASQIGTLPLYQEVFPLFQQDWTLLQTPVDFGFATGQIDGNLRLAGSVTVTVEVVEMDFDRFELGLEARSGGLDVDIDAGGGSEPGVKLAVVTTAAVDAALRFSSVSGTIEGFDLLTVGCLLLPGVLGPEGDSILSTLCPDANGVRAPLAGLDPFATLDSDLSVGKLALDTGFNVSTTAGGAVDVQLVEGTVDFLNSQVDLNLIKNITIDLGNVTILGGALVLDLGTVPLQGLANGLASIVDPLGNVLLNDLQPVTEVAINAFLLNPSDPLALGSLLETTIANFAPYGPVAVQPFLEATPDLYLGSAIDGISFASSGGNLNAGGMTLSVATLFYGPKVTQRQPEGVALKADCYGEEAPTGPSFSGAQPIDQGLSVDAVNQAIFGAWWNGAFDGDAVDANYGLAVATGYDLEISSLTAPMLEACGDSIELQIADVHIDGAVQTVGGTVAVEAYVSLSVPVSVTIDSEGRYLLIADSENLSWQSEIVGGDETEAAPLRLILAQIVEQRLLAIGVNEVLAAMPVPSLDLGAALGVDGAVSLVQSPSVAVLSGDYVVRSGVGSQ